MSWDLTDHVCGACLGRILRDGDVHRCSNCGATDRRGRVEAICACGSNTRVGRPLGLRCARNDNPTPEFPGEIIAITAPVVAPRR